jgi:Holliday junction resolvase
VPNRNYVKGVRKERKIVNDARACGHIAFRSAGSHSPIDVIIINSEASRILLIQCKPDNMSLSKKHELEEKLKHLNAQFDVSFIVA